MKISIPIEEKVIASSIELECPYYIHNETDMDEDGYLTEYFYKIVSPIKVIQITISSRCGKEQTYQIDFKFDWKNPAYGIPRFALTDSYYKCEASEFNLKLNEALQFFAQ